MFKRIVSKILNWKPWRKKEKIHVFKHMNNAPVTNVGLKDLKWTAAGESVVTETEKDKNAPDVNPCRDITDLNRDVIKKQYAGPLGIHHREATWLPPVKRVVGEVKISESAPRRGIIRGSSTHTHEERINGNRAKVERIYDSSRRLVKTKVTELDDFGKLIKRYEL